MRLYIVKDTYQEQLCLVNAESAEKACSMFYNYNKTSDSKLSDYNATPLEYYIRKAEEESISMIIR